MARKRWSSLLAIALALPLVRCAGTGSQPVAGRPEGPPTSVPASKFSSPAEAEALLVELEARRAFDEPILSAAAKASDAATRARVALAVGRIGDERGRPLLQRLLADRAAPVRAAAAFACQVTGDSLLTPDLVPLLSDPEPTVVVAAAKAVGFLARGDGQDALVTAIPAAASPEPRAAMLESLWRFATSATQAVVLGYAADPDPKVRTAALYALSRKPLASSIEVLTNALNDSSPYAAAMAARALGLLERKESIEPLAAALETGMTPLVVNSLVALEAILEKNPGVSVPESRIRRILALAGDANPNVALSALVLLRQFAGADREVYRRLWSIAISGEGRRREVALQSVAAVLRGKAETALQKAASSSEPRLRAAAAESLIYLSPSEAKAFRERLASDASPLVRLAVLVGLKTPEAVKENRALINSALTDPDTGVRATAIDALSLLNDPSIIPILAEALAKSEGEPSPDVALAVIGACEKLRGDPAARTVVESAYRHPKALVARAARRALLRVFRVDPSAFSAPEYKTGRTTAEYAALLSEAKKPWRVQVETLRGTFTMRLAGEQAPITVVNFVKLAREKFFDGVAIHRVVPNFVIQDGDPSGTGNGGPGYEIRDEINPFEYGRGAVGMALSGPDTGGSQWFVTQSPQPHLNGIYTVFGQVVFGQDVVERIEQGDRIVRVTISEAP